MMEKRKTWFIGSHDACIEASMTGWMQSFRLIFQVDPYDRDVCISFGWGLSFWFTFSNILPKFWYPKEKREIGIRFDREFFRWNFWNEPWEGPDNHWSYGSFDFRRFFLGNMTADWINHETEIFTLPFEEGNYQVHVTRRTLVRKYPRWFTETQRSFEVKVGYYNSKKKFIRQCIPHEGKGENSWDQGEDGTYASSFSADRDTHTCYDAALQFWVRQMKTRADRARPNWVPAKFKGLIRHLR